MAFFKARYRIESVRLPGWDYASPGWYFITVCTHRHEHSFGCIADGVMQYSSVGEIARQYFAEIPLHCPNASVDVYQIMPNHLHGIIVIERRVVEAGVRGNCSVMSEISPRAGSLSAIVRSYKSAVSNWCHHNGYPDFRWQNRFYDVIIRDERILKCIRRYIVNNPAKWESDALYSR